MAEGNKNNTIKSILKLRDEARLEIYDKARQLDDQLETLKDIGYSRPLNNAETALLKKINAAKGSLYSAENELVLMTVVALDKSAEVTRFINVVNATNKDLKSKLNDVGAIAEKIKKLDALLQKVTAVVTGLTKLLPLLA